MNARSLLFHRTAMAVLSGLILVGATLNAQAQPNAVLDAGDPVPATLMPAMVVTASASNPSASQRWRLAATRPRPVTLMPTLTVKPDLDAIAAEYIAGLPALAAVSSDAIQP